MRCRKCNVDVAETYNKCPLCCSDIFDDAPLIKGINTAEFPKIAESKKIINVFPVFLTVWAVLGVIALILKFNGILTDFSASLMITVIPLLWTLVFRPIFVKQCYSGNYVVMNIYPCALFVCLYGYFSKLDFSFFSFYLAGVALVIGLILFVFILFKKKDSVRSSSYFVLLTAFSVCFLVASFVKSAFDISLIYPIVISAAGLLLLFTRYGTSLSDELKAKFSIQ